MPRVQATFCGLLILIWIFGLPVLWIGWIQGEPLPSAGVLIFMHVGWFVLVLLLVSLIAAAVTAVCRSFRRSRVFNEELREAARRARVASAASPGLHGHARSLRLQRVLRCAPGAQAVVTLIAAPAISAVGRAGL